MSLLIQVLLFWLFLYRVKSDSESDPDYAVAYDAAVAYLKANPFALNQQGDPYIYVQVKVDENRRSSSAYDEIQDIHLPSQVLKEIQDSYAEKDRLEISDVEEEEDRLDTAASFVSQKIVAAEDGRIQDYKLDTVTGYTKKDTFNTIDVYAKKDTLIKEAGIEKEHTLRKVDESDSVASYISGETLDTSFIDVEFPYNQPEPYLDIQVPHQLDQYQDYKYLTQPNFYTQQQNPYLHQQNPYVHNVVPYVHEEVPYIHEEVPYVHEEKDNTHTMTSFVDIGLDTRAKNTGDMHSFVDVRMDSRTPKTLTEANYGSGSNPYVDIQLTLRVPYEELESGSQHFADPALEFAYRSRQRQPRGNAGAMEGQAFSSPQGYTDKQYEALNDFASLQDLVNSVQWQRIK